MYELRGGSYEATSSIDAGLIMQNSSIAKKLDIKGTLMQIWKSLYMFVFV